jgi:hypothetical protein
MTRRVPLSLLVLGLAFSGPARADTTVQFNRDIRPILSDNCFACHGPDKGKRKADLRLDTKDGAFAELISGAFALVPKKPGQSELYLRISHKNPRKRMPPSGSGKSLSARQVELLRRWIEQGAKWQKHWALIPPVRVVVPRPGGGKWARNAVDRFVLSRLEREKLEPSRQADRRTLIRRLSFDLTGLPPTPVQVDAFLADRSADAYEKLVERMLASRHYGERMALYWLDLVRFGDTGGYHSDNHRDIYLYRDFIIEAFNANKRFDTFTTEQVAGDLLPNPTPQQKIASGYNRLLMTTEEGGAQAREYLAKYAADRVRNASTVWLGLTMGCAECHDHKFDPVKTREFYRFASFFADIQEVAVGRQPQVRIPSAGQSLRLAQLDGQITATRKVLTTPTKEVSAGQARWEGLERARLSKARPSWTAVRPEKAVSSGKATLTVQDDLSVLSGGTNPAKDTYTVTLKTDLKNITGIQLEALTHPTFGNKSLSRGNGNFVLTRFAVSAAGPGKKAEPVKLRQALADYSQPGFPVASLLLARPTTGWAVAGYLQRVNRTAVFVLDKPIPGGRGTTLTVRLVHASIYPQHNIGRFRLSLTTVAKPALDDKGGLPVAVVQALLADPAKRAPAQKDVLAKYYRAIAPELAPARNKLAALERAKAALTKSMPMTLISVSGAPRMMRVLRRGNWLDDSGEIVAPGTPASLNPLKFKGKRATRLDLAKWLTAKDNPLVARVFVNRLWKLFFGQGIVTTLDDFGSQGAPPTHPELLDWLAVEFRESGWDVKHLVKLMVTSATYRQSSHTPEALRQRDPYNRLLARQGRWRLDAELVRDNALAVSGLLVERLGGPSVKPYQPAGYWAYLNFPVRDYYPDKGPNQYRRGLYTYVQRTFPHPSLIAFDGSSREECTVERPRSNTPLQALVLLNDPTYVESARALAERTLRKGGKDDQARLHYAYRRVLSRKARPAEVKLLLRLLARHLEQYRADRKAADELLSVGFSPVGKDVDRPALAAWTSVARVLLNLHETITRD